MKFEPLVFIRLAQRNGISMTRIEGNIKVKNVPGYWLPVIKRHKRQILKHLPDDEQERVQLDIFYDN